MAFLLEKEFLNYKIFSCYCGLNLKHIIQKTKKIKKYKCNMMKLDQNLNIGSYECLTHNQTIFAFAQLFAILNVILITLMKSTRNFLANVTLIIIPTLTKWLLVFL